MTRLLSNPWQGFLSNQDIGWFVIIIEFDTLGFHPQTGDGVWHHLKAERVSLSVWLSTPLELYSNGRKRIFYIVATWTWLQACHDNLPTGSELTISQISPSTFSCVEHGTTVACVFLANSFAKSWLKFKTRKSAAVILFWIFHLAAKYIPSKGPW